MLKVEFAFMNLVHEEDEAIQVPTPVDLLPADSSAFHDSSLVLNLPPQNANEILEEGNTPQMENADLAEADQSHLEVEEEGAVGGMVFKRPRSPELVSSFKKICSASLQITIYDLGTVGSGTA